MAVLILSTTSNEHANRIQECLDAHDQEVLRVNADALATNPFPLAVIDHRCIQPDSITSVFHHHFRITVPSQCASDQTEQELFIASWRNGIDWLEQTNSDRKWVNYPSACASASSVCRQLVLAQHIGFRVPSSCFTNVHSKLEEFTRASKQIILKPGPLQGLHLDGNRILSRIVTADAIDPDVLSRAPCLFQEYIEKQFELRVHVIGDRVLACRIDSQANEDTRIDWRNYNIAETPHYPFNLPSNIEEKCVRITKALNLSLGIIDLIVTANNDIVFLECNAQGHWIWIEELTGLPITNTVVRLLCYEERSSA